MDLRMKSISSASLVTVPAATIHCWSHHNVEMLLPFQ